MGRHATCAVNDSVVLHAGIRPAAAFHAYPQFLIPSQASPPHSMGWQTPAALLAGMPQVDVPVTSSDGGCQADDGEVALPSAAALWPKVQWVEPCTGAGGESHSLIVTGSGFLPSRFAVQSQQGQQGACSSMYGGSSDAILPVAVSIGGTPCTGVVVLSDTRLRCIFSPPEASATHECEVVVTVCLPLAVSCCALTMLTALLCVTILLAGVRALHEQCVA